VSRQPLNEIENRVVWKPARGAPSGSPRHHAAPRRFEATDVPDEDGRARAVAAAKFTRPTQSSLQMR
jgi:hypothetical protein